jgi:DNA processing protein
MNRADAAAWLRLFLAVRLERRQWSGLVGAWPDPRRIGAQSVDALCQAGRLAPDTARRLREGAPQEQVEAELALMESRRARLVMCFDPDYPDILRRMTIPPAVFYMAGEYLGCDEAAVAVVGPRLASVHGREAARRIAHGLASAGLTIVSGFAVGIDSAAHVAALDAGGRTLAVLGCGLGVDYPANHAELRARIVEAGAARS